MPTSTLVLVLLALIAIAYRFGRARSLAVVGGSRGARNLHSLPSYYGFLTALWCGLPALLVLLVWHVAQDGIITNVVLGQMPETHQLEPSELNLLMNDVRNVVAGNLQAAQVSPAAARAAAEYLRLRSVGNAALTVLALVVAMVGS